MSGSNKNRCLVGTAHIITHLQYNFIHSTSSSNGATPQKIIRSKSQKDSAADSLQ